MKNLDLPQRIIQKFREERLSVVPRIIEQASNIPVSHRWDVLFRVSTNPFSEVISVDIQDELMSVYQVSRLEDLAPRYVGAGEQWGLIVTPRMRTWSRQRIAFLEHWFVTKKSDWTAIVNIVKQEWPLPFDAIQVAFHPQHRGTSYLCEWGHAQLEACAYVGDWGSTLSMVPNSDLSRRFSLDFNQDLDAWWPDLCRLIEPNVLGPDRAIVITQLRKGIDQSRLNGGILNLYDEQGLAGHVSWSLGSDAELLIPQCWQIQFIVVRPDLRGQGIGKHLYTEAAQKMNLSMIPLVCARVQSDNLPSLKALEAVGTERVLESFLLA